MNWYNMRICSYLLTNDAGLAPNPFWGYCTLAVCTPNHMGIKPITGDWFIGFTTKSKGNKLIYAMQVSEFLSFDSYYNDPRFENKKPNIKGSWHELCGDNMYYRDDNGKWAKHRSIYHQDKISINKDLRYPVVFVAEHFYYFGDKAINIPQNFGILIWGRQGCKCSFETSIVESFTAWLQATYNPGIHGKPSNSCDLGDCNCLATDE